VLAYTQSCDEVRCIAPGRAEFATPTALSSASSPEGTAYTRSTAPLDEGLHRSAMVARPTHSTPETELWGRTVAVTTGLAFHTFATTCAQSPHEIATPDCTGACPRVGGRRALALLPSGLGSSLSTSNSDAPLTLSSAVAADATDCKLSVLALGRTGDRFE